MFNILEEWLTHRLGIDNCLNLNFSNVGKKFKDGILFAHLLNKYQVIPDCYSNNFEKTNFYAVCLRNMKNISLWLKFLDIIIEDCVIHEIACGQSLAVIKLLYQLYFKFEMSKQYQVFDNETKKANKQLHNNFCKSNDLCNSLNQERRKYERKISNLNNRKIFNVPKLPCDSEDIQYNSTYITKSIKVSKFDTLDFMQHNMNNFSNLFEKKLNNKLFKRELKETSNGQFNSTIINILNTKEEDSIKADKLKNNFTYQINNLDFNKDLYNKNVIAIQVNKYSEHKISENVISVSDNFPYLSQEDFQTKNSTFNHLKTGSIITQTSNELDTHSINHVTFYDYLQHNGLWSSEYLNIRPFKSKQNVLSMIVKEVLNFEYGISEIRFIKIKKANLAGVIDVIQNAEVVQIIKNNLKNREILSFTADEAILACLNAYKEEMKTSVIKGELYEVFDDYEHQIITKKSNSKEKENPDAKNEEIKKKTGNSSTNSMSNKNNSVTNISSESILITNEKLRANKLTQTPENIPEPDYNNPVLSSMATLGKLIDEKHTKSHCIQIGDKINCIGEFIKKNQNKNGWILLEFPVQPLQMALLEYKLTGKILPFGREVCGYTKNNSCILPEYQETENEYTPINTYLSYCIKIIKHKHEINSEKWNDFLQFYNEQNCIQILHSHLDNNTDDNEKVANFLIEMILNEENKPENNQIFTSVNIFDTDQHGSEFSNYENQISESSIITVGDSNIITTNQFQLISTDLSKNGSILTNNTNTALYLRDKWEALESSYTNQIKNSLNSKDNFFEVVKTIKELIITTMNQIIKFDNPRIINLINKYESKCKTLFTNNAKKNELDIFELQANLWDEVDSELEKITEFIKHTIDSQNINKNHTLIIGIYKQLLKIELERATATIHFLNKYYDDINQYEIKEFNFSFCTEIINIGDDPDQFQILCIKIINIFENYVNENYELIKIDVYSWVQSVITEKNRFINQVYRIKASMLLDIKYLIDLTRKDLYLEKLKSYYKFKINDINNLCELLKCAADPGSNFKGNIRQISGEFYINELSVFEIIYNQIIQTHSRNLFNMKQLNAIVHKLLDNVPCFKMSTQDLINTLNELCKIQNIYPKNWPKNKDFYYQLLKEIFGINIITIDWRDFIVQCMQLPCPNMEQLLFYRHLFKGYDVGNETITEENYEITKLWFENESNQYNEAKWLLYDMYQIQNRLNYSHMLLAFCKDKQPEIGLGKSFGLIFGWDPFDSEKCHINLSNYQHEGTDNDMEYENSDIQSSNFSNEEFVFDKNIMTWFLITNLKMYINSENLIGNVDISQIVKAVFVLVQTKQVKPTFIDLFQNNIMDSLYKAVCKFQTKELSEVAKTIVMKYYNLNIHNV